MKSYRFLIDYIQGRPCALLGLGVSHLPLAHALLEAGIPFSVYDKKKPSALGADAIRFANEGIRFVTGEDCFTRIDEPLIFRSPGIRPDLPGLLRAKEQGAELISEVELFLHLTEAQSFAITGSDGKTTSTTLTGLFLEAEAKERGTGQVFVGGNIGTPLLTRCGDMTSQDCAVLELSSFQLMGLRHAPRYTALTNLSPNHLDWHHGMEEYIAAKSNIVGSHTQRFVTNADNALSASLARQLASRGIPELILFSSVRTSPEEFDRDFPFPHKKIYSRAGTVYYHDGNTEQAILRADRLRVPGRHNLENLMTAIGLTWGHVSLPQYAEVVSAFTGVEHRLEYVRTLDGVDYFNSSIDSSPTRTAAALSALAGRDIVILCGGYDKKIPYEPLAQSLCKHARAVVLTGATAQKIRAALDSCPLYDPTRLTVVHEPDFACAVLRAKELARPGGCVLLSPASASFDNFKNFAHRGQTFKQLVWKL